MGKIFSPILPNRVFTSSIPEFPLTTLRLGITPVQDDFLLPVPSYTATTNCILTTIVTWHLIENLSDNKGLTIKYTF